MYGQVPTSRPYLFVRQEKFQNAPFYTIRVNTSSLLRELNFNLLYFILIIYIYFHFSLYTTPLLVLYLSFPPLHSSPRLFVSFRLTSRCCGDTIINPSALSILHMADNLDNGTSPY
jgi:hypothetical protein